MVQMPQDSYTPLFIFCRWKHIFISPRIQRFLEKKHVCSEKATVKREQYLYVSYDYAISLDKSIEVSAIQDFHNLSGIY